MNSLVGLAVVKEDAVTRIGTNETRRLCRACRLVRLDELPVVQESSVEPTPTKSVVPVGAGERSRSQFSSNSQRAVSLFGAYRHAATAGSKQAWRHGDKTGVISACTVWHVRSCFVNVDLADLSSVYAYAFAFTEASASDRLVLAIAFPFLRSFFTTVGE